MPRSRFYDWRSALLWIGLGSLLFPALLFAGFIASWTIGENLEKFLGQTATAIVFGIFLGGLGGAGASLGSGLAIRRLGLSLGRWLLGSIMLSAALLGIVMGFIQMAAGLENLPSSVVGIALGSAFGLSLGLGQWLVLRQVVARSGLWMPLSLVAYLAGLGLGFYLSENDDWGLVFVGLIPMTLTWLGMGRLWRAGPALTEEETNRPLVWIGVGLVLVLIVAAALVIVNPSSEPLPPPLPTVDPDQQLIFFNGVILTMNEDQPQVQAVAIKGQKISAVGSDEDILALQEANSQVIDLEGRTLMPGFVDAHSHLFNDAESSFDMSLAEIQQVGLENGITALGDLYVNSSFLKEIQEFEAGGLLQIRTSLYLVATDPCGKSQGDWYLEQRPSDRALEMLRIAGVKIFTDGGTCETPATSYEVHPGEGQGDLFFSQEELDTLVAAIHQAGFQVAIHAIGDQAVEQAQNAIAAALAGEPNDLRHRIEHNSIVRPELIPRYGEIGIVPVVFGLYPTCNPFGPPPPEAYQAWEWPYRAMLDANPGLKLAWSGDDPFFGRVRPLDDLYSLVTRNDIDESGQICQAPAWQQQHLVTVEEALRMMTTNAAYALFREDELGQVVPGLAADLIVLTDNPLAVEVEALPELDVLMTMVGGRTAHCAAGFEHFCPSLKIISR